MPYHSRVDALAEDAEHLEIVYHSAQEAGEAELFKQAIDHSHLLAPENLLYAAWYHRLKNTAAKAKDFAIAWAWALPLALLNGLLFWWLSDDKKFMIELAKARPYTGTNFMPAIVLWLGPIAAAFIVIYLMAVGRKRWLLAAAGVAVPLAAVGYVLLAYPQAGSLPFQRQYLELSAIHLPLLAWAGVGAILTLGEKDPAARFAFLIKSLEVAIMAGLFVIAGGLLTGITIGLFDALDVRIPDVVQRLFIAGGGGLIPVIATAVIYNPKAAPADQSFDAGLSKLLAMLMRVFLPLSLLVLVVYIGFIPFNFKAPFDNRDVLIVYNGMLFAVVALLVGATPVKLSELPARLGRWLRVGIIALASLALLVSLYALAAIVYRTVIDRLTPNRLAFIGWNVINIGLLSLLLFYQVRAEAGRWVRALHRAFSAGTVAYAVWTLIVILVVPWPFGIRQGEIEALPAEVQNIVYENADPILLKCARSDHIYLLDRGQKRWIDTIETFEARGYTWRDVHLITCIDLGLIPDGVPIPEDAGPPPQP